MLNPDEINQLAHQRREEADRRLADQDRLEADRDAAARRMEVEVRELCGQFYAWAKKSKLPTQPLTRWRKGWRIACKKTTSSEKTMTENLFVTTSGEIVHVLHYGEPPEEMSRLDFPVRLFYLKAHVVAGTAEGHFHKFSPEDVKRAIVKHVSDTGIEFR